MKRILSIIVLLSLLLVACGKDQPAAASSRPTVEKIPAEEMISAEEVVSVEEPEVVEEPEEIIPEPEVEESEITVSDDELECLEVIEEHAAKIGGLFLRRNGRLYTLNEGPMGIANLYDIGIMREDTTPPYSGVLTKLYVQFSYANQSWLSIGDVPLVSIAGNDELISYIDTKIDIYKVDNYGYGIPLVVRDSDDSELFIHHTDMPSIKIDLDHVKQFEIRDSDGEVVDLKDCYNMVYGQNYTISWFDGTTYNEYDLVADCHYYHHNWEEETPVTLEGVLQKDGYALYDLSSLEPGLYMVRGKGPIEIK